MPKSFLLKRGLTKECHCTKELRPFIKPAKPMNFFWNSYLDVGMPFLQFPPSYFVSKMKNAIDFSAKEASSSNLHSFGAQNQQESLYINEGQASLREGMTEWQGSNDALIKRPFFRGGVSQNEKRLNTFKAENRSSSYGEKSKDEVRSPTQQPFKCDQCGKVFKTKYTLTIHLKMPSHTGARPFVCGICGKGFRLSSTLCRHKIIHTSEKPHKCHICQKAFNRSSTLKTHIRTHSEIKEFICDICGKGFHQKGNLRNHALIHTGEKPYTCSLCEKAFNKLSNLKFHMHTHTDNTPYRCRFCKESFTRRCDLKQHLSLCYLRS